MKKITTTLLLATFLFTSCEKEELENTEDDNITCGIFTGKRSYTTAGDKYITIDINGVEKTISLVDKSIYTKIEEDTEVCFETDYNGDNIGIVSYTESDEPFISNSGIVFTSDLPCNCYFD